MIAVPFAAVAAHAAGLAERTRALQGEANSPERKALVKEHDELADREWLAGERGRTGAVVADLDAVLRARGVIETS